MSLDEKVSKQNAILIDSLFDDEAPEVISRLNKNGELSEVGIGIHSREGFDNYEKVIKFLNDFDSLQNRKSSSIATYISTMVKKHSELRNWTITVVSPPRNKSVELGLKNIKSIRPVLRSETDEKAGVRNTVINCKKNYISFSKSFTNASDLICDLNLDELNSINFNIYRSRKARSPKKGLLLIYPIIATDVKGTSSEIFLYLLMQ